MRLAMHNLVLLLCAVIALTACGPQSAKPQFFETENPLALSDWNLFSVSGEALILHDRVLPYDLNTPLFTDYAHKLRTVWMPEGTSAKYVDDNVFDFPVGTVISKTFYYPRVIDGNDPQEIAQTDDYSRDFNGSGLDLTQVRLIETRLLLRRQSGWVALPYVWNAQQTEATLKRTGDIKPLVLVADNGQKAPFNYVIPNTNQCSGCHAVNNTTRDIQPIGPKARHLNKPYFNTSGPDNQIDQWAEVGYLIGAPEPKAAPKLTNWLDKNSLLDERARAYLDINCAHCHNEKGPADTSGLHFEPDTAYGPHLGVCKTSIAAGGGTGGHMYDIVPGEPENSILIYRLASTDPGEMMPELGRSTEHKEGVALLEEWIDAMNGTCE